MAHATDHIGDVFYFYFHFTFYFVHQISSDSLSEEDSDLEDSWYSKLQEELNDEYNSTWGCYEEG